MEFKFKLSTFNICFICQKNKLNNDNFNLKRRMLDMGITGGVVVKIKKVAPFGDPISIELRGYELCLRKSELANIEVERL